MNFDDHAIAKFKIQQREFDMMTAFLRKDIKSLILLYRATRDTGKAERYHSLVDGKHPLLLLISTDNFGTIGVYTSIV